MSRDRRAQALATLSREVRGWQSAQELFDGAAADLAGLNRTAWRCLDILGTRGPMTAGELADAAQLTTGAVTGVLDNLERAGYVRRVRDTTDRRKVIVEVAPDLETRAAPAFAPFLADSEAALQRFSEEDLETIAEFVRLNRDLLLRHTERLREMSGSGRPWDGSVAAGAGPRADDGGAIR